MRKVLLILGFIGAAVAVEAQQDPQFTQWFNDKLSFNPATAGINNAHCLSMFYRSQWGGLDRQPKTAMFNYSGAVEPAHGGIGLTFYNDKLGQEQNTIVRGAYAFHANPNSQGGIFTAGLALGFYGKKLGNDWVAIDPVANDNAIPNNATASNSFDLNLGVYYYKPNSYYVGLSSTHLTQADLKEMSITVARHYYFMGGYDFQLPSSLVLRTNLLAKTDFNASTVDINANVLWNNMIYAGLSYRPGDAVAPMAGIEYCTSKSTKTMKSETCFKLGYSYDATTSELRNYSSGSHEIFLGCCFKFQTIQIRNQYANPRFL